MEYIVDHETIKSWTIYKSIIYLKNGLYISPCFKTNVDQYIKPLTNFKNAQGSPKKRAKTQRYRYSASLLSNKNRRKNHNPKSGFSGSFCYSLAKSNAPAEGHGLHPFFDPHGPKNSLRFSAHKVDSKKIGANKRTEKIAPSNFCLPIFC